VKLRKVLLRKS